MLKIKSNKKVLIFLIIFAALALIIIFYFLFVRKGGEDYVEYNPIALALDVELSDNSESKLFTSEADISLDIQTDLGVVSYQIPSGASDSSLNFSITEVSSITGIPEGNEFITGVDLSPKGATFFETTSLVFDARDFEMYEDLYFFKYEDNSDFIEILSFYIDEGNIIIPISGHSGVGVGNGDLGKNEGARSKLNQKIRDGEIDYEEAEKLLNEIFKAEVLPELELAQTKEDFILKSFRTYIKWLSFANLVGFNEMPKETETTIKKLDSAMDKATDKSLDRCINQKDAKEAGRLMAWIKIAQHIELEAKSKVFDLEDMKDKVRKCGKFKLEMTSIIQDEFGFLSESQGSLVLSVDSDFAELEGEGVHTLVRYEEYPNPRPECSISGVLTNPLGAIMSLDSLQGGYPIDLIVSINPKGEYAQDVTYFCQFDSGNLNVTEGNPWIVDFDILHEDDIANLKTLEEDEIEWFKINNWIESFELGMLATSTYQRNKDGIEETTTFKLIHIPE